MAYNPASKKILFLPFLQIPSGHHQVAAALMETINKEIETEKVDLLSYSYGKLEKFISAIYLKWIHSFPSLYNLIYKFSVCQNRSQSKRFPLYEILFMPFMKRLLKESNPDFIICTHALPSYLLNQIKERHGLKVPVLNIYTDYFIHDIWGIKHIDHHFVPSEIQKQFLLKLGVRAEQIYLTGIPVHLDIRESSNVMFAPVNPALLNILVSGGSLGAGELEKLINKLQECSAAHFYVLCGKNKGLYKKLSERKWSNIFPLEYISCRKKMNALYESMDAVISKPGGVTVSECLHKRKPMFVYHSLPGQEKINVENLKKLGLVFSMENWKKLSSIENELQNILKDPVQFNSFHNRVDFYHEQLHPHHPSKIVEDLLVKR
ncbi:MGDG synthase family glycosyltransferase [Peribacillus deserti]|uniref:UDP-glucuronosyltransferase n=1 Tax=Peribacillus deserti TaxID=673318 RepID=A0A2N5M6L8_9BACI|nr:glycosyltransferase [Peribacillus deserti]PLT30014.1 UDP-glucuronosyltransferase [Peribacillus deserti]